MQSKTTIKLSVVVFCLLSISVFLEFYNFRSHYSLDSNLWIDYGKRFITAVVNQEWLATHLTTKPAVTVMWLTGLVHLLRDNVPALRAISEFSVFNTPFIIIDSLSLVATFYLLWKLLGFAHNTPVMMLLLLIFNPYFSFSGQLVWTDKLVTWFIWLSFLSFLCCASYLRGRYALLTGIFFGLGILTKIASLVIIPVSLLTIVILELAKNKNTINLHKNIYYLSVSLGLGLIIFYLLYPASWFNFSIITDRASELSVSRDSTNDLATIAVYYLKQFFFIEPLTLFIFILSLPLYIFAKLRMKDVSVDLDILSAILISFFIFLLVGYTGRLGNYSVGSIISPRYLMMAFPFLVFSSLRMLGSIGVLLKLKLTYTIIVFTWGLTYILVSVSNIFFFFIHLLTYI